MDADTFQEPLLEVREYSEWYPVIDKYLQYIIGSSTWTHFKNYKPLLEIHQDNEGSPEIEKNYTPLSEHGGGHILRTSKFCWRFIKVVKDFQ